MEAFGKSVAASRSPCSEPSARCLGPRLTLRSINDYDNWSMRERATRKFEAHGCSAFFSCSPFRKSVRQPRKWNAETYRVDVSFAACVRAAVPFSSPTIAVVPFAGHVNRLVCSTYRRVARPTKDLSREECASTCRGFVSRRARGPE